MLNLFFNTLLTITPHNTQKKEEEEKKEQRMAALQAHFFNKSPFGDLHF